MIDIESALGSLPAECDHIFLQIMVQFDFVAFDEQVVGILMQNVEMSAGVDVFGFEVQTLNQFIERFEQLVVLAFTADREFYGLDHITQLAHFMSINIRFNYLFVEIFVDVACELIDVHQFQDATGFQLLFVFEQKLLHH